MAPEFDFGLLGGPAIPTPDPFVPVPGLDGQPVMVPREYLGDASAPSQPSPVVQPAPQEQAQDVTVAPPPGYTQSESVSFGRSGPRYTPEQAQGFTRGLRGDLARADAAGEARLQEQLASADALAANQQETARERGDVEAKIAAAQAPIIEDSAKRARDFARFEEGFQALSQQEAQAYRQRYEKSVAELGAMQVDPARLYRSGVGGFANALAAGIGGFLTARGVENDIVGQLNRNIDRDITAQMENIRNKKQVTDGFAQAYRMLVDENDSAAQARLKMQGFYMDQAAKQMQAEAAKYGSALATIGTEENVNKLQAERFKLGMDLEKAQADRIAEDKRAAIAVAQNALGYAQIEASERMSKAQLEAQKAAAAAKAAPALGAGALRAGNRKLVGKIAPTFADDKETVREVQARILAQEDLLTKGEKIVSLLKKVGPQFKGGLGVTSGGIASAWLASGDPAAEELRSAYVDYLNTKLYAETGKAVNESELKRQLAKYPMEGFITGSNSARVFSSRLRDDNRTVQSALNAYVVPLDEAELAVTQEGGQNYSPFQDHGKLLDAQARDMDKRDDDIDKLKSAALSPEADALEHPTRHIVGAGPSDPQDIPAYNKRIIDTFGVDPAGQTDGTAAVDSLTSKLFSPFTEADDRARIIDFLSQFAEGGYEIPRSTQRRAKESLDEIYKLADQNPGLFPGLTRR